MSEVKYPEITVTLTGEDGNAFNLIGIVTKALRKAGVFRDDITVFNNEAFAAKSYDELLQHLMKTVNVS